MITENSPKFAKGSELCFEAENYLLMPLNATQNYNCMAGRKDMAHEFIEYALENIYIGLNNMRKNGAMHRLLLIGLMNDPKYVKDFERTFQAWLRTKGSEDVADAKRYVMAIAEDLRENGK